MAYTCFKCTFWCQPVKCSYEQAPTIHLNKMVALHGFSIILLSMIWCIKKVFIDEKELDSTPVSLSKKFVRHKKGKQ